jgi:Iap family predicted aminopeptidase
MEALEASDPWERALRLYRGGAPLIPGVHDREALDSILEAFDAWLTRLGGEVRRFHLPTLSWRLRHAEAEPGGRLVVGPYVERGDVEGRVELLEGDPSRPESWRGFRGSPIVVAPEPGEPDELRYAALLAAEHGAEALLICPRVAPRLVVTVGSWGFSFHAGAPTPVLVGYLESSDACPRVAGGGRARVAVESRTVETVTWGLEVDLPGRGRPWLFTAHWDRWRGGFQDDTLGVAQAFTAAFRLASLGLRARVAVFPSEEHGAPGYAGWYWAWGSRRYAVELARSGLAESIAGAVNFDVAGTAPLIASGSPALLAALPPGGWRARPWECPECDSMQLALHAGIPTLSIHTLWSPRVLDFYHTSLDAPDAADPRAARLAVELAVRAALRGPRWECMEAAVRGLLAPGPLEARRLAVLVLQAARRVGWESLHPPLARAALRPIDYGDRRWSTGPLEAHWFPEASLLPRLRSGLARGQDPGEVWVAGWERLLYQTRPGPRGRPCSASCLSQQARQAIEELSVRVEEALRPLLA